MSASTVQQGKISQFSENRIEKWVRWFAVLSGGILLITGLAKITSALGTVRALQLTDPIFGVTFAHLILAVGILELIVSMVCIFGKRIKVQLGLIAWLATSFLLYRFGLFWVGYHGHCSCLGNFTDDLPISPQMAETLLKGILLFLLIGSYITVGLLWKQSRKV